MPREVIMPALGMAQNTGLIVAWLKKPGEKVKAGDALMEVETDKAVMEVEAQADGFLTDVRASAGDTVPVGDVVALISESPAGLPTAPASGVESNAHSRAADKSAVTPAPEIDPNARTKRVAAPVPSTRAAPKSNPNPAEGRVPNSFTELEQKVAGRRIFASPKARRLAAEQGLDLSRLVAAGIPQPYHASDLDTLRALPAPLAVSAPEPTHASRHLTARVRSDGFVGFCEWMRAETGASPDATSVMASMAAAALRQGASDKPMIVAAEAFGRKRLYIDPDRLGLGRAKSTEPTESPTLILRDLRGTAVTAIRMGGEAAPVLSVTRDGPDMLITLECAPGQLTPEAAVELISGFAGQLSEPLRHLL
jgi:pyruvate/2-oxoglutarate dehydrogenase complex dihydrolipoamide acyltransferase (E2) component